MMFVLLIQPAAFSHFNVDHFFIPLSLSLSVPSKRLYFPTTFWSELDESHRKDQSLILVIINELYASPKQSSPVS